MGRIGRDVYRRKLKRYLAHSLDEPMISLISAVVATQAGPQRSCSASRPARTATFRE